ncbi:SDR family oxidoreductase [Alcanivorax jadensis]|mgnify:FL=1|jgi:UDP-glucose 4-epimerase|uniref:SDR family oxidoreductase n=2 Tax=Alcanivorax TaxID=59753 RepID=UPI000C49C112|nr:SDR family oxidoreductase [Alcanivorax jadensis]MBG33131.1 epimerase [Alcanivorax sp.]MDF1635963.1 SDR family oxidoreductase [Alcanivorax jadensis]|tara:strand:- start:359 stop:1297 length:939 start_codon:yes stop_codon:yes gene_type:complete
MRRRILITGAAGYIGSQVARRLSQDHHVVGVDIRADDSAGFPFYEMDIRDPNLGRLLGEHHIQQVVHLAAVLEDSGDRARDFDIDVNGTRNVLDACVAAGVEQLVVTSSGAAYGYHPDNPAWLDEDDALRGNPEFPYSDHKRQVENLLAEYRQKHPALKQLVLRPGTVLGANTRNLITRLFEKPRLVAVAGSPSPFVFIWDQDVVAIIQKGVLEGKAGRYNLAGDGALSIHELGRLLGKPVVSVPAGLIRAALWIGNRLGLTRYTPGQVNFLRYRPVLANRRLKEDFGYIPRKTSEQVFRFYIAGQQQRNDE